MWEVEWRGLRVRGSCLRGIFLRERTCGFNLPRPNAGKVPKHGIDGVPGTQDFLAGRAVDKLWITCGKSVENDCNGCVTKLY